MRLPTPSVYVAALALFAGLPAATQAQQVIFNENFSGSYAFGTSQYLGGSPSAYFNQVAASGGNPSGPCWVESMTTTTWGDYYAGQVQLMTVTGNTDPNPGDYTLSFDALGSQAANIQLGLQSWQNNYFGGSQIMNATLNDQLAAANTWQTFSVNLGTVSGANPTGATWQFNFQLNSWQWGGPGNTDNLSIDNITLTEVPEPGAVALVGVGAAVLLVLRRRR
jgi:hypothetical protein